MDEYIGGCANIGGFVYVGMYVGKHSWAGHVYVWVYV